MHTPLRMCIACREMKPKDELIKFVKTESGALVDFEMKMPGRGAYICKNSSCLENAKKRRGLSKHFKMQIDECVYCEAQEAIKNE